MKWAGVIFAAAMLLGCGNKIDSKEAVQRGILQDVRKRADVDSMNVTVNSVSFRGNEADAVVNYAPKGAPQASGITMRYTLERKGDEWKVKDRSMGDLRKHTGGAAEVPGEGGQMGTPPGQLPPGHPAVPNRGSEIQP